MLWQGSSQTVEKGLNDGRCHPLQGVYWKMVPFTPYFHCMARCVRRAFLCGKDKFSGKNYEHRRQWIVDRLKELANIFALEICAYAVMSNHYHVVLHINRGKVKNWDAREILHRWTQLFAGPYLVKCYLARDVLSKAELLRVEEYASEYRSRLMDISWYMRCLNEHLARLANKEDNCKVRFWEGRYKSQALLDEAALLTCMAYVDLNPVWANTATLETSEYTSIKDRIEAYFPLHWGVLNAFGQGARGEVAVVPAIQR